MKSLRLKGKIILPIAILILAILSVVVTITIMQFSSFTQDLVDERLETAAHGIRDIANEARLSTIYRGISVSNDPLTIQAILDNDTPTAFRAIDELMPRYGANTLMIANAEGIVLGRSWNRAQYGDMTVSPIQLSSLRGEVPVQITPLGGYYFPIRSTVPVHHDGSIIGFVVVGFALDTAEYVRTLGERFDAEITLFYEHTRVASTLTDAQGNSVVGTPAIDAAIIDQVTNSRIEYRTTAVRDGREFSAVYLPLLDPDGNVFGTIFMGLPLEAINQQNITVIVTVVIVSAIGLALAFGILYILVSRVSKPINALSAAGQQIAEGNLSVNFDTRRTDEIGELAKSFANIQTIVGTMVNDMTNAYSEYVKVGDMHHQIDDGKYQNSYKEMIGLVNNLLSTVTSDIGEVASVMNSLAEGSFSKKINYDNWAGEWIVVPNALGGLANNLKSISAEVSAMIESIAQKGDLNFKIDIDNYKGDWSKIMEGLNSISKAVYEPIRAIEMGLLEMRSGNFDLESIDKKITQAGYRPNANSYNGTFKNTISAFDETITSISIYINEIEGVLAQMAEGDLRNTIKREYVGSFDLIKRSVNNINNTLHKTLSEISAAADQVLTGASQISNSATELSNGAQEQSSSVQELNATVDMLSGQTQQNAESAVIANELSSKSTTNAQEGNIAMGQMVEAMNAIKDSSNNIGAIVKTIQDIAFQTNLLALNASVEAARAGEHGKGFAVVADEVRSLAGRSQEAATQTTTLIQDSINRVETGGDIAETTAGSLNAIVASAGEVLAVITKISEASREQAEAIAQVSDGLAQIARVTQNNSAVSEETAATSEELNSQAEVLRQLVSFFKL